MEILELEATAILQISGGDVPENDGEVPGTEVDPNAPGWGDDY